MQCNNGVMVSIMPQPRFVKLPNSPDDTTVKNSTTLVTSVHVCTSELGREEQVD